MGPIEVIFFVIALMITLIGIARGYHKELGSTTIILVAIFVLTFFEITIEGILRSIVSRIVSIAGIPTTYQELILSLTFQIGFILIVFAGYAGVTLDYGGKPAKPPKGTIYSILIGGLNGYLISGTLWYYQHTFNYPAQLFGLIALPLTPTAEVMVTLLPQTLFPTPIYWMLPVAALLILRVRG